MRTLRPAAPPATSPHPAGLVGKPAPAVHVDETLSFVPRASDTTKEPGKASVNRRAARHSPPSDPTTGSPASAAEDRLRAETEALRLAQHALREKAPERALELLDEQDLRFRDGQLPQERTAARILALCQAGRVAEARVQAVRFERLWPHSALLGRVRAACWTP